MNGIARITSSETRAPSSLPNSPASQPSPKSDDSRVSAVALPRFSFLATRSTSSLSPQPSLATWGPDLDVEQQLPLFDFTQYGPDIGGTLRSFGHVLTEGELSEIKDAAKQASPENESSAMNLALVNISLKRRDLEMLQVGIFHISEQDKEILRKDLSAFTQIEENVGPPILETNIENSLIHFAADLTRDEFAEIRRAGKQVAPESQNSAMNLSLAHIALKRRNKEMLQCSISNLSNTEKEILRKELDAFAHSLVVLN